MSSHIYDITARCFAHLMYGEADAFHRQLELVMRFHKTFECCNLLPSLLLPTFFSSLSAFSTFHLPSLCPSLPLKRPTIFRTKTSSLLLCFSICTSHSVIHCFFSFLLFIYLFPSSVLCHRSLCLFFVCYIHLSIFFPHPLSGPSLSILLVSSTSIFTFPSVFPPSSCCPFITPLGCVPSSSLLS